ncbi:GntT/GntP/DsdX family permease [Pelosinus baikalensis]|nr:SLC13 family permease [Pelosinus baikalensis]
MIVSFFVGLSTGMLLDKIVASIQAGLGNTLRFIAIVLGLGTMLGKLMEESGAAERVARTLINRFGEKNVHWAMMFVAFIVGLPTAILAGPVFATFISKKIKIAPPQSMTNT